MVKEETLNQQEVKPASLLSDTEQQAVMACQQGQLEEFTKLYDLYVRKIYNYIFFRVYHKEQTEDLTSQVFLKALKNISSYSSAKGSFQAWIYQIAKNALVDEYRKKKAIENIDDYQNISDDTNLEITLDQIFAEEEIQKLLLTLPKETKELVVMRVWDELSYAEIAQITGKTEGSLKMQFVRAIKLLKLSVTVILVSFLIF